MWGLARELLLVVALIAALAAAAWLSGPTENYLHTGKTCHEILERLAAKNYRGLTPAEATDRANCEN